MSGAQAAAPMVQELEGWGVPTVSIVVPFFWLTKISIIGSLP